jgi:Domain of unknown function (DUF4389)
VTEHPVRLVVTDDLQRSRLTVFFRLLLAIPHFIWLALWGIVVLVVAFINWWATLFRGISPRGLHDFLAGYVRYATQVEAYLWLIANPYPPFFVGSANTYPVDVEIAPPARQNRWVTGFRVILVIPAALLSSAFSGGGYGGGRGYGFNSGVVSTCGFLSWFSSLARGRSPRGLRDLSAWGLGYSAQVFAYFLLLTDRYPYSGFEVHVAPAEGDLHPARLVVGDDLRRSRLTVFFRLLLALPHIVWLLLWTVVAWITGFLNWLVTLVRGSSPRPFQRFLSAYIRYQAHVGAFLYLAANPFPGFIGKPGSYPVDVEVKLAERQNRWKTGFRLVLAIPAFLISTALAGLAGAAAFLGWFASLVRGRMPEGLRNAIAYNLRYQAGLSMYFFVLNDRYPYSGPTTE